MISIQEVSGETLFKLSQEVLSIETSELWHNTHVLVLKDFVKFNKDYECVFHSRQILYSGETYMTMLKSAQRKNNFKMVLEIKDYWLDLCPDWQSALGSVWEFVRKHKLSGIKLCLSEDLKLNYDNVRAVESVLNETDTDWLFVLEFHESLLKYIGYIQHLCHLADYILFPLQGYFDKQYVKAVYGYKFEKLIINNDRGIAKVEAHLNSWLVQAIPRSKLVAYVSTTGVAMEIDIAGDYIFNVYEVPRSAIYQRVDGNVESGEILEINAGYGYKIFFDSHQELKKKIRVMMITHGFAGVCMQELHYDLLWKDKRSVFGVVKEVCEHIFSPVVSSPSGTGGILPGGIGVQMFQSTPSTEGPR